MSVVQGEDQYRTLVQMAPDVIYGLASDGTFTSLSPAFERITGWSAADWLGKPFAGLIHPDDLPRAIEQFQLNLRGVTPEPYQLRIRSRGGDYLVGEIHGLPAIKDGEIVGSIGIARDVTDRWHAEHALKESRDQLRVVLETVEDGITVQRPDGALVYANEAAARMIGVTTPGDVVGAPVGAIASRYEVLDEEGEVLPVERFPNRRALAGEHPPEALVRFHARDGARDGDAPTGEDHWALLKSTPVLDEAGKVRFAVTIFKDVTERWRAEEARLRLAAIVESSEDAIIGKTLDAVITSWNPAAERLYGWTAEEVIGKRITLLVPEDRPDEIPSIMARLRRGEPVTHFETVRRHKDGYLIDVWISVSPIRDSAGRVIGAATIARDNRDRMRVERERTELLEREQDARRQAQDALRLREEFLSIASHELKTPLTSLQLQVQMLDRFLRGGALQTLSSERVASILDGSGRQIKRLSKLITDLLDVSRIAAGKLELEITRVDLGELAEEVVERFRAEAAAAGCQIHLEAGGDVVGNWDRFRLDQVITNLLSNAIRYGDGGSIEVRVECLDATARLTVQDEGIGIATEHLDRVFDRFERMTSDQSYGGLGLGLYIASQIVQELGGTIRVESELGRGSVFVVELPAGCRL